MRILHFLLFIVSFYLISCNKNANPTDVIPVHQTFNINSKLLNESRVINVWLPKNYDTTVDSFSVVYMADGGISEDFPHVANTFEELINQNKIKPIILVGIENTERRRDLTGFTENAEDKKIAPEVGGSTKFRWFIKNELFPEVKKRYKINDQKSILGESASGLFVMETFLLDPEMFDNYIAFDPSLWWNNQYLVNTAKDHLKKFPTNQKKLWFTSSAATDIFPHTNKLAQILKAQNITNLNFNYSQHPNEKHTTIFRATKEQAFIWTFSQQ